MENIASDIREAFWDNMRHPLNDNIKYYINIEKVYVKFWNNILQDIKHILAKNGFALGGIGSVTWAFKKEKNPEGLVWTPTSTIPLSDTDLELLDKLVEDLEENDDVQEVYTNAE